MTVLSLKSVNKVAEKCTHHHGYGHDSCKIKYLFTFIWALNSLDVYFEY